MLTNGTLLESVTIYFICMYVCTVYTHTHTHTHTHTRTALFLVIVPYKTITMLKCFIFILNLLSTHEALQVEKVVADAVHIRADGRVEGGDEELHLGPGREAVRITRQMQDQIDAPVDLEERHGHQDGQRTSLEAQLLGPLLGCRRRRDTRTLPDPHRLLLND